MIKTKDGTTFMVFGFGGIGVHQATTKVNQDKVPAVAFTNIDPHNIGELVLTPGTTRPDVVMTFNEESSVDLVIAYLQRVKAKFANKNWIEEDLDEMMNKIDDLVLRGRFTEIDRILSTADVQSEDINIIVGLLTITCGVKDKLQRRKPFFDRAIEYAKTQDYWDEKIFEGLE